MRRQSCVELCTIFRIPSADRRVVRGCPSPAVTPLSHTPSGAWRDLMVGAGGGRRYQSTVMGSFQSLDLIETFISYQESIRRCIAIAVDPHAYASGSPALRVPPPPSLCARI